MDSLIDILMAFGVGAAAGLAPFVAIAAAVLFTALHIGINPDGSDFSFFNDGVAVIIAALVLVQSLVADVTGSGMRIRVAADRRIHPAVHILVAAVFGGLAGSVVFGAQDLDVAIGAIVGVLGAILVAYGGSEFFQRVGERVKRQRDEKAAKGEKADSGAIALAVDVLTILAVLASLLAPPLGLVLPVLVLVSMIGRRRKQQQKYEGLRSLR